LVIDSDLDLNLNLNLYRLCDLCVFCVDRMRWCRCDVSTAKYDGLDLVLWLLPTLRTQFN